MAVIPEAVQAAAAAAESLIHPVVFIVVPVIFLVFTMISVSLRIYVRTILTKAYGYDDWALIFALVGWTFRTCTKLLTDSFVQLIYTGYVALFILIGVSEHIYGLLTILDVLVKVSNRIVTYGKAYTDNASSMPSPDKCCILSQV